MFVNFTTKRVTKGDKFGRYTVLGTFRELGTYKYYALCECSCGSGPRYVLISPLTNGEAKSCGCLHREQVTTHGHWQHPLYRVWKAMHERCYQPTNKRYSRYGGRGIKVCPEWHDIRTFISDMEPTYKKGLTIDRKNNDGNYGKENCRWATRGQQNRNYSRNKLFTHNGETLCLKEWSERLGINYGTLWDRLYVQNLSFHSSISKNNVKTTTS